MHQTTHHTHDLLCKLNQVKKSINLATTDEKNNALIAMAENLIHAIPEILSANEKDISQASGRISNAMIDRLYLNENRIRQMAQGIKMVANLPDPIGEILATTTLENGLIINQIRVAIGVIGIIYESRPNVTSDATALAIKSGNACILRSGKDAYHSAKAIVRALKKGLAQTQIHPDCLQLVEDTSRESAHQLMKAKGLIDLLIPRGGAGLIQTVIENATVPVIETGTGICHIYVDEHADPTMALSIIENAKTSRPSVCNAAEVCLIHQNIAPTFLPQLKQQLVDERKIKGLTPVELRLDDTAAKWISGTVAHYKDFESEFLDYILAIKIVASTEEAIAHIEQHSTQHSEAIITQSPEQAQLFCQQVDSAAVYVNASTRFTDGGEFGLGCEMGISTQKLHARGPMGLKALTTYKYLINGNGQIRV